MHTYTCTCTHAHSRDTFTYFYTDTQTKRCDTMYLHLQSLTWDKHKPVKCRMMIINMSLIEHFFYKFTPVTLVICNRTWTSVSSESVRWNACVHRLDISLYSHQKEFWGNGVRTQVNSKGKIPFAGKILPRGGSNPWNCIKQDSEFNTLPTSYFSPQYQDQSQKTKSNALLSINYFENDYQVG